MGRIIREVLQFCIDVVQRRPHKLDRLMYLLNLDSQELLTNENLQEVTSLLKDHYDLLVRFSRIFMPSNYKLAPWKDITNNRVYCMLSKGDAMYKLTALDGDIQQYDAIEAAKCHEDQIVKTKRSSHLIPHVSIDSESLSEALGGLVQPGDGSDNAAASALPIPLEQYNKLIENAITINIMSSQFQSTNDKTEPKPTTTTTTKTTKPAITKATTAMATQEAAPPPPSRKRPSSSTILEQPVETRGSRTRPSFRKFSLAVPFLYDLSTNELMEFLHHKEIIPEDESPVIDKEHTVQMIIKDCNFSDSTPFEMLPTFLKNFKNR